MSGAGEMKEEDDGAAGDAEGWEEEDSREEGSSQGGEDEDGTPSWVLGGFESAEAEQKYLEREQWSERMWERIAESQRACKEQKARIKELEREGKHWR